LPDVIIRLAFVRLHHEHNLADVHSFPSARSNGTIVSMYANGAHRRITRRMRDAGLVTSDGGPMPAVALMPRSVHSGRSTVSLSLYDISVASYLQTLRAMSAVLDKGADYAGDGHIDLDNIVRYRLRDDMAPFSFQVISVWHHSMNAIQGLKQGLFQPPPKMSGLDYEKLKALVSEATASLEAESREDIDALEDQDMIFKMGDREIPFTAANFVLSFSLPNFYFHAATLYDILRLHGVPLGKRDYLGTLRIGQG
jgi:hypothetical protein